MSTAFRSRRTTAGRAPSEALAALERALVTQVAAESVAAIVIEPVQGEGGFVVAPPEFLAGVRRICDDNGIVLVVDEVQTGFGRTGKMWGIEHYDVEPDLMTVAKSIAAACPCPACSVARRSWTLLATRRSAAPTSATRSRRRPRSPSSTCFEEEGLVERAAQLGDTIRERMQAWQQRWPAIGDVRGLGAMLAIELVHDPATKESRAGARHEGRRGGCRTRPPAPQVRDLLELHPRARPARDLGCAARRGARRLGRRPRLSTVRLNADRPKVAGFLIAVIAELAAVRPRHASASGVHASCSVVGGVLAFGWVIALAARATGRRNDEPCPSGSSPASSCSSTRSGAEACGSACASGAYGARPPGSVLPVVGEKIAGRYEVEELVGHGGMSSVYRAHDSLLERHVALKILHEQYSGDEDFVERFKREARTVAQLQHPNIVTVIDRGEEDGRQYIVFEYIDGENLKELRRAARAGSTCARRSRSRSRSRAASRSRTSNGLIHRDVKPQNVLLNGDGRAKVTDFGIARTLDVDGMTQTGTVLGTSNYIAPEQASGQRVDAHSDVYSLGAVLYELLAGEVPFPGESFVAVAMKHVHEPAPNMLDVRGDVPLRVAAAVDRALEKDPEQRFPTMAAFAAELEAASRSSTAARTATRRW